MRLAGGLSQETVEAQRHKHLAYILNEQAQLNNGNNTTLNLNKVCWDAFFVLQSCFLGRKSKMNPPCGLFLGGEETVPAQKIHPHLSVIWPGRGGSPEIKEH